MAGAIRSLLAYQVLDIGEPQRIQLPTRRHHCPSLTYLLYQTSLVCATLSDRIQNFLNNQPRNRALAPLALQACLIVIAQNAASCNLPFIIPAFQTLSMSQTRMNTGQTAIHPCSLSSRSMSISTVFHRLARLFAGCSRLGIAKQNAF